MILDLSHFAGKNAEVNAPANTEKNCVLNSLLPRIQNPCVIEDVRRGMVE